MIQHFFLRIHIRFALFLFPKAVVTFPASVCLPGGLHAFPKPACLLNPTALLLGSYIHEGTASSTVTVANTLKADLWFPQSQSVLL